MCKFYSMQYALIFEKGLFKGMLHLKKESNEWLKEKQMVVLDWEKCKISYSILDGCIFPSLIL